MGICQNIHLEIIIFNVENYHDSHSHKILSFS